MVSRQAGERKCGRADEHTRTHTPAHAHSLPSIALTHAILAFSSSGSARDGDDTSGGPSAAFAL